MSNHKIYASSSLGRIITRALKNDNADRIRILLATGMITPTTRISNNRLAHLAFKLEATRTLTALREAGVHPNNISEDLTSIKSSGNLSVGITRDGTLWVWGKSRVGVTQDNKPTIIAHHLHDAAVGNAHILILKRDGTLHTVGSNNAGQLGDGTRTTRRTPKHIMSNVRAIAAAGYQSFAIQNDGTLWGWGNDTDGQTGANQTTARTISQPTLVMRDVTHVAPGRDFTLIQTGTDVYAVGSNEYCQLASAYIGGIKREPQFATGNVTHVTAGDHHAFAIKTDGTLVGWGLSDQGLLGLGYKRERINPYPTVIMRNTKSITASQNHTIATTHDNQLYTWGENRFGQLGDGTRTPTPQPKHVMNNITKAFAGNHQTYAMRNDGIIWAINDSVL